MELARKSGELAVEDYEEAKDAVEAMHETLAAKQAENKIRTDQMKEE